MVKSLLPGRAAAAGVLGSWRPRAGHLAGQAGAAAAWTESASGTALQTEDTEDAADAPCPGGTCGISRCWGAHSAETGQTEHLSICNIGLGPGKRSVVPPAAVISKSYNLTRSSVRAKPY